MNRITIIGDGAWGTALALLLHSKGCSIKIWGYFPDYIEEQREKRENYKFLPGVKIPGDITYTADLAERLQKVPNCSSVRSPHSSSEVSLKSFPRTIQGECQLSPLQKASSRKP